MLEKSVHLLRIITGNLVQSECSSVPHKCPHTLINSDVKGVEGCLVMVIRQGFVA